MELRPIQSALLAGRVASRWTSSTPAIPSLHRHFTTTRPFLSEADADSHAPSMVAWRKSFEQQKQQQQQQPQQSSRQAGGQSTSNIYTFLSQRPSGQTSASGSSSSPTGASSKLSVPWAQPSSRRPSAGASALRNANNTSGSGDVNVIEDLGLFADLNRAPRPAVDDFAKAHQYKRESVMDVKLRLRPSVGRTVNCGKGSKVDLARGLQLLNSQVRKNRIQQDLFRQRFHERPGLKRKRLKSERWRARFKDGFKATCGRVRELARQGW